MNPIVLPLPSIHGIIAGIPHALIGGYAVNVWVPPRETSDIDLTIAADHASFARLAERLGSAGLTKTEEHGAEAPSGPDFQRFKSKSGRIIVEFLVAKTAFQHEVIQRAVPLPSGLRVATPEDLLVLKLIADRSKDEKDLIALCALPDLDWGYVDDWAEEWGVRDRIPRYRRK